MIDLEQLRRVATEADGNVVVTGRWLRQALQELEAARQPQPVTATLDFKVLERR